MKKTVCSYFGSWFINYHATLPKQKNPISLTKLTKMTSSVFWKNGIWKINLVLAKLFTIKCCNKRQKRNYSNHPIKGQNDHWMIVYLWRIRSKDSFKSYPINHLFWSFVMFHYWSNKHLKLKDQCDRWKIVLWDGLEAKIPLKVTW